MENGFDFYIVVRLLRTPAYDNESLDYWAYRDYGEAMGKYHDELGNCWKMFDATPDGMVMDSSNFKEWRDGDGNGFVIYCAGEEFCDSKGKKRHEEND